VGVRSDDYQVEPPADTGVMLRGLTLPRIFAGAAGRAPDAVAITDGARSLTWRQWQADVAAVARGLQEAGIGRHDVVAVRLPNGLDYETLHLAIATIGAVTMPVHLGLGRTDAIALLGRVEPEAVVLPSGAVDEAAILLREVPGLRVALVAGGDTGPEAGLLPLGALRDRWQGSAPRPVQVRPDMPFVLLPSSGTTSLRPKICLHSHDGLLSNAAAALDRNGAGQAFTGVVMAANPLTHLFGLQSMWSALLTACPQALLPRWDLDGFFELSGQVSPAVVFAVPAQLHDIARRLRDCGPAGFAPRQVWTAGAALPAALAAELRAGLGAELVVFWGMSEIGHGACTQGIDPAARPPGSVGRPVPGSAVRIRDAEGQPAPAGTPGELQYAGAGMFRGYYREPELTAASVTPDGWLRTGDTAAITPDGQVVFHGRSAELINVGGQKFNASEIQDLLAELPGLGPLAVVAKPDPRLGEYPCLVVTEVGAEAADLAAVAAFLRGRGVADYKIPAQVVVVDELPRTAAGKLNRRVLEEMLRSPADPIPAVRAVAGPRTAELDGLAVRPGGFAAALVMVLEQTAAVLGLAPEAVAPEVAFRSQGISSLLAIRLRDQLAAAAGRELPASLAFDYPSPVAVARLLAGDAAAAEDLVPAVAAADPVVVVGMACRYPGGIETPEQLWDVVTSGTDVIGGFPADRGWDLDVLFDDDPDQVGTSYTRAGGFLADVAGFDPGFFGIGPREAAALDPQQRLLLETAWEALEQAGIDPATLRGSAVGVFAGAMQDHYAHDAVPDSPELEGLLALGTAGSAVSGRVSYALGLEGPAVTVDTACSSSLVAMHLAAQAIRSGECSLALAGGVTVLATPRPFLEFSRLGVLSRDGRCKAYAEAADGAAWSEGAGVVVLERLSDARRGGHEVLAVIRSSAVNQDGASNGLTAPNGPAQQRVIRRALAAAELRPSEVDVVEGHGTGTALGDPIEAQALIATYGQDRPADRPLLLGSVKSNIGHTQAAAGAAGVIKMLLALRHGTVPPTLHVDAPSGHVDWSAGAVRLVTKALPWPDAGRPRRAAVSSFGASGTNAHLILEQAPAMESTAAETPAGQAPEPAVVPWILSARTEPALRAQARKLLDHLAGHPGQRAADTAFSLATRRSLLERRAVVVGAGDELLTGLRALAAGDEAAGLVTGRQAARRDRKVALVFPGQGSEWAGMGTRLMHDSPEFARRMGECATALAPYTDWSLLDVIAGAAGAPGLDRADVVQPTLFAVMVSLAEMWKARGLRPAAVLGHSQGEIAAACAAGGLSLDDGARVVALRSRLIKERLSGRGGMLSVLAPAGVVRSVAAGLGERIAVAAMNGPRSVTVSGDPDALTELDGRLAAAGVARRRLTGVTFAAHSAQLEPLEDELARLLDGLVPGHGQIPFFSTVTGGWLPAASLDAKYWYRNVREPVRLEESVRALTAEGFDTFIECSPHPVLAVGIEDTVADARAEAVVIGSLRRNEDGTARVLTALAEAHVNGVPVDWQAAVAGGRPATLPTYPFQRERYWIDQPSAPRPARTAEPHELYAVQWTELSVQDGTRAAEPPLAWTVSGLPAPGDVPVPAPGLVALRLDGASGPGDGVSSAAAQRLASEVLTFLQSWLADSRFDDSRLILATRGAVTVGRGDEASSPVAAAVWGLAGSAQSEHPGRVLLADLDDSESAATALPTAAAAAFSVGEPRLAVRDGAVLVPRLAREETTAPVLGKTGEASAWQWDPRGVGTVLVTGGTGTIGTAVARHLVTRHGVRRLLLLSRSGVAAPGVPTLLAELSAAGAEVRVAACDVADRAALAGVLAAIPAGQPLTAVIHTAGAVDDALLAGQTAGHLARVFGPKADAAWHLHELTRDLDLSAFVLCSSYAGVAGAAGQANYAAANAYLDALVQHRRALGLPGVSLAWGFWAERSRLTGGLEAADIARFARGGVLPLSTEQALGSLDAAAESGRPLLVLARFDRHLSDVPPLLRGLVQAPPPPAAGSARPWGDRLSGLRAADQEALLLDLIRGHVAVLLGHPSSAAVEAERGFIDLGMSSLTGVELRNRLNAETSLRLPATLIFDQPAPVTLARHMRTLLSPGEAQAAAPPVFAELDELETAVAAAVLDRAERARLVTRLKALQWKLDEVGQSGPADDAGQFLAGTDDDIFKAIDKELGLS
jgi:acyl transferase domain-containing protein/acyl-CoA synthetase (AMP-forming)/AMP-acid ligase II